MSLNRALLFLCPEPANDAMDVLVTDNTQHPKDLRKWVRKHFAIMRIGESNHLMEKKSENPVCVRERLYDVIGGLHEELQHAGYRKTFACVKMLTLYSRFANNIAGFH